MNLPKMQKKKVNFVFIFEFFFQLWNLNCVWFDFRSKICKNFFYNLYQIQIGPIGLLKDLILCLLPLPPFPPICPCSIQPLLVVTLCIMHLDFRVRCVVVIDVPDLDKWLVSHPGYPYLSLYLIMTLQEKP